MNLQKKVFDVFWLALVLTKPLLGLLKIERQMLAFLNQDQQDVLTKAKSIEPLNA